MRDNEKNINILTYNISYLGSKYLLTFSNLTEQSKHGHLQTSLPTRWCSCCKLQLHCHCLKSCYVTVTKITAFSGRTPQASICIFCTILHLDGFFVFILTYLIKVFLSYIYELIIYVIYAINHQPKQ